MQPSFPKKNQAKTLRSSLRLNSILKTSWKLFKTEHSIVRKVFACLILLAMIGNLAIRVSTGFSALLVFFVQVAFIVLLLLFSAGSLHIFAALAAGKAVDVSMLWRFTDRLGQYVLVSVLYILIVSVGLLLFIVPGIIWATAFSLAPSLVARNNIRATEALQISARLTNGHKLRLFWLYVVFLGMNTAAGVALMFGLLVTIPLSYIAVGVIFHQLATQSPELLTEK